MTDPYGAISRPDRRLVKAIGHPLRFRILELVVLAGEESPSKLAKLLDHPLPTVSRHVRMLRDLGFLELSRAVPRRGAVEHFYRAKELAFIDDTEWAELPPTLRRGLAWQTFRSIFYEAAEAGGRGGFDAPEMHLDRLSLRLDDAGRKELSALLHRTMRAVEAVQRRCDDRAHDPDARVPSTVALLHFVAGGGSEHASADHSRPPFR